MSSYLVAEIDSPTETSWGRKGSLTRSFRGIAACSGVVGDKVVWMALPWEMRVWGCFESQNHGPYLVTYFPQLSLEFKGFITSPHSPSIWGAHVLAYEPVLNISDSNKSSSKRKRGDRLLRFCLSLNESVLSFWRSVVERSLLEVQGRSLSSLGMEVQGRSLSSLGMEVGFGYFQPSAVIYVTGYTDPLCPSF